VYIYQPIHVPVDSAGENGIDKRSLLLLEYASLSQSTVDGPHIALDWLKSK